MFDQVLDNFRKASESSMQMQQDLLRQWSQPWLSMAPGATDASADWGRTLQKRLLELTLEVLNKHRESLDSTYRSSIQVIEQTARVSEAKSSEDARRTIEDVLHVLFDTLKTQSDAQLVDLQRWAAKSFDVIQKSSG